MSALPPGWNAHQAPDGRWYFSNSATGQTQWHHPAAPPPNPTYAQNAYSPYPSQQPQPAVNTGGTGVPPMSSAAQRFILHQPTEFKLQEKAFSLSGDSFNIKRVDTGETFFKVKGNALSLKDSKTLFDINGNAIYKMSEALLSLRGRMSIIDPMTKQPVVTLRKKGFVPGFGTRVIQAWAGGSDEGQPYLEVKGDFLRKDFTIRQVSTGQVVASVKRKSFNLANILLEKDTYIIRVEPGVDAAMLVFFVVAADEQYRDDGNRMGLL